MRYQFVQGQAGHFRVAALCRVMQVSVSGYYAWRSRPRSRRSRQDRRLLVHIRSVLEASDKTYGSPRIYQEFKESGMGWGKRRVARRVRPSGIRPGPVKRFVATTDSRHALPVHENVLDRQFEAQAVNTRWSCDISGIPARDCCVTATPAALAQHRAAMFTHA